MSRLTNKECYRYEDFVFSLRNKLITPNEIDNSIYKKLKSLEDIEEELGIDLIILFDIERQLNTKEKIWFKIEDEIDESYRCDGDYYIIDLKHKAFVKIVCEPIDYLYFKDYGKTWALDKQTLEK